MPKRNTITKTQHKAIRTYVKQGFSANKIQKNLSKRGLGIRRKTLLAEIRKIKRQKPMVDRLKYTPRKYRKHLPKARKPVFIGKHIAVYRYARTKRHPRPYSARFEFYGSGKDLAKAIRLTLSGIVPRWERPFVECSAMSFMSNPYRHGERGIWTARPNIES